MNKNTCDELNPSGWPLDWATDLRFRGVTRSGAHRRYVVRLSVCATKFSIATTASQTRAARLYDLALWKLACFVSRQIRPNFPGDFAVVTQAMVDEQCPLLNEIYAKCSSAAALSDELTERERREAALSPPPFVAPAPKFKAASYGRYQRLVDKMRAHCILTLSRLSVIRHTLDLSKLPEVSQLLEDYESALDEAEKTGGALRMVLESHREFYGKLLANKDTAV